MPADLTPQITGPSTQGQGSQVTYTIGIENLGTVATSGPISVTVTLSSFLGGVVGDPLTGWLFGGVSGNTSTFLSSPGFTIPGSTTSSAATMAITASVPAVGATFTITATLADGSGGDTNTGNNSTVHTVTVV